MLRKRPLHNRGLNRIAVLTISVSLTGPIAEAGTQTQDVMYKCDRGVDLMVSYINPDNENGLAVMLVEGKLVTMRSVPTGSGVRYIAMDEQDSYRLYTKGDEAFVRHLAADHTAEEVAILSDCHRVE